MNKISKLKQTESCNMGIIDPLGLGNVKLKEDNTHNVLTSKEDLKI